MARAVLLIIKKEVMEMTRDPRLLLGMIIVPMLMFPMMGLAMSASVSSVEESASSVEVGIIDLDGGRESWNMTSYLLYKGVKSVPYGTEDLELMMAGEEYPVDLFMVIQPGFTDAIENNGSALVLLYTPLEAYSLSEGVPAETVTGHIEEYRQLLLNERISGAFPNQDASTVNNPISVGSLSVVKGEIVQHSPAEVTGRMMVQSLTVPMILMILLIMAAQLAATSVAMEKEEKTLETLLTTPVPRSAILLGKIIGVVIISAVAVLAYVLGFSFYMSRAMGAEGAGVDLAAIGLAPSVAGVGVLVITLFLSLVSALSLSVLVASFTEDVRSAQAILGAIYAPIFIPAIILMLVDISQLPGSAQAVILAIPFTYPVLAAKSMYTGDFTLVFFGIFYQVIFTAAIIYIASRFFSSEKIMTARLSFRLGRPAPPGRKG